MPITISVPRETRTDEQRVALVPDMVKKLASSGVTVRVQTGAGDAAGYNDSDYESSSAVIAEDEESLYKNSDIVLIVNPPDEKQIRQLPSDSILIGFLDPHNDTDRFKLLQANGISAFAMEIVPRISRAQAMDALSSQASVAGYKAVLVASTLSGKFFPMLTTAAGTVRPSRILIIGAGVAGLQAIATARRLGAIVEAYDVRTAVKEQVESLGAKFVDIDIKAEGDGGYARELTESEQQQQQAILACHIAAADVVVTTAAIPGMPSPRIISKAMIEGMKGGSVVVDLAAEGGGNCELTQPGETVVHNRVKIHGPLNVPSTLPNHASELYARNLVNLLGLIVKDGAVNIDLKDQVVKESLITHQGVIVNPGVSMKIERTPAQTKGQSND